MPRKVTTTAVAEKPVTTAAVDPLPAPATPPTVVVCILDRSGSMLSIKDATISGFNEYLSGLRRDTETQYLFSLTLFDSMTLERRHHLVPISEVPPLTGDTYRPGASTPLYDAVVETVEAEHAELAKRGERNPVLVVIMTDGEENSSTKHDESCLRQVVSSLEKGGKGDWTFTYLGANQDAWAVAQKWGFAKNNTLTWDATPQAAAATFSTLSSSTATYAATARSAVASGAASYSASNFFVDPSAGSAPVTIPPSSAVPPPTAAPPPPVARTFHHPSPTAPTHRHQGATTKGHSHELA